MKQKEENSHLLIRNWIEFLTTDNQANAQVLNDIYFLAMLLILKLFP